VELAIGAGTALLRLAVFTCTRATFEDSYISLRYAENLAAGAGLVYNPGERVFGASTPLYVLFLAFLSWFGLPALDVARFVAAAADGVTVVLWLRWLAGVPGSAPARLWFGLLFGLSPALLIVTTSGMETSFALLCLTLAVHYEREGRPRRLGAALGLLTLLRPDGLLAAVLLLSPTAVRERRLPWRTLVVGLLVLAPWLLFAWIYYGTAVPHSIPAKLAAYNLHRTGWLPNWRAVGSQIAPLDGPVWRLLLHFVTLPFLVVGVRAALQNPERRPLAILGIGWFLYLIVPKTLLFTWYFPLLLLPAYALTAVGVGSVTSTAHWSTRRTVPLTGLVGLLLLGWLVWSAERAARIQRAEVGVRRAIGLWLRENTPSVAQIAMEPIGYIGYFSRRRILDEVGLVSPEMVPLTRQGAGWFGRMIREFRPDWIVERTRYLAENRTLNSHVAMFADREEQRRFHTEYRSVARFSAPEAPELLRAHYEFEIFHRRPPETEPAEVSNSGKEPRPAAAKESSGQD